MMIRSIPPASSALAERPVPAPPPTIGRPSAIVACSLSRIALRGIAGIVASSLRYIEECCDRDLREGGVVDMQRQTDDPSLFGLSHRALERGEQGGIRLRIEESAAFPVKRGDALLGDQYANLSLARVQLLPDPRADTSAFVDICAHKGHIGIVPVKIAPVQFRWNCLRRPEIHHVECAYRADIGEAGAGDGSEPVFCRR